MRSRVRMAIDAGKLGIVRRHLVAVSTDRVMVGDRKIGVVEGRTQPARGCVASVARCRVSSRDVVRDRAAERLCAVPLREVASIAGRVRRRE